MSEKKIGVYVDGKLKLQTRNIEKAHHASQKWMQRGHDVWVAPVGSFVTV